MTNPQNTFKSAIIARRRQTGLWLALADPYTAEICATAGFDWLLVDAEHGPNDLQLVLAQLQALSAHNSQILVRLPDHSPASIKQMLDIGVRTLMIPMVQNGEQARSLAAAVTYPPDGIRGVASSMTRASLWNSTPNYVLTARNEICLVAQIECRQGLENVSSIAGTAGIDAIFVGPADLAASLGHLGNPSHPEVQAAIEYCIREVTRCGKPAGIFSVSSEDAERYAGMGFCFISAGTDVGLLARSSRALAKQYGCDGRG